MQQWEKFTFDFKFFQLLTFKVLDEVYVAPTYILTQGYTDVMRVLVVADIEIASI
jgi:hypothetical protein